MGYPSINKIIGEIFLSKLVCFGENHRSVKNYLEKITEKNPHQL